MNGERKDTLKLQENYKGLSRWYVSIAKRPAVIKGFKVLNKDAEIDYP